MGTTLVGTAEMNEYQRVRILVRLSDKIPTRQVLVEIFRIPQFSDYRPQVGVPNGDGVLECWINVGGELSTERLRSLIVEVLANHQLTGAAPSRIPRSRWDSVEVVNTTTLDVLVQGSASV